MGLSAQKFIQSVISNFPNSKYQFTAYPDSLSIHIPDSKNYLSGNVRLQVWSKTFAFIPSNLYSQFQKRAEEKTRTTIKSLKVKFDIEEMRRPEAVAKDLFPKLLKFANLLKTCHALQNARREKNNILRERLCTDIVYETAKGSVNFHISNEGEIELKIRTVFVEFAESVLKAGGFQK